MATNDEFERNMSFIVEQQAQFASDIQQLRESQTETNQVVAQTGEIVARLAYATLEGFKEVNVKIDALVDAQIRTDEHLKRTDEQLRQTDEQLQRTTEQQRLTDKQLRQTDEQLQRTTEPSDLRQTFAVPSTLPLARNSPSGLNVTRKTAFECPANVR